ncbi:uncharacterized protein CDAR_557931 [Caerostris darwini]|uniref:Uncharacterized protein n=1 Tax=Caerostris darwini TaxID=1538125 RepID=A0AAV4MCU4_9ARAC|nr:uncharacterized protein CDAR_557931 [Caerostris darwini]
MTMIISGYTTIAWVHLGTYTTSNCTSVCKEILCPCAHNIITKLEKYNGTNAEPPAQDSSHSVPELYVFSPVYLDWYVWMTIIIIGCIAIASVFLCLGCCRKPYKTAVVRLSEELPSHFPGTGTALQWVAKSPNINIHRLETPRLATPCKPLEPAYQPTQLLTITTVRLPYLTSDLALPPGYVSLRDTK